MCQPTDSIVSVDLFLCHYVIDYYLIKEFIERKPVSLKFLRVCAVICTRWPPSSSSHLAPFPLGPFPPRSSPPLGNFRKAIGSCRHCTESCRGFPESYRTGSDVSLVPRVPRRRPLQRPGHQGRHYRSLPALTNIVSHGIMDHFRDAILRTDMKTRKWSIIPGTLNSVLTWSAGSHL